MDDFLTSHQRMSDHDLLIELANDLKWLRERQEEHLREHKDERSWVRRLVLASVPVASAAGGGMAALLKLFGV